MRRWSKRQNDIIDLYADNSRHLLIYGTPGTAKSSMAMLIMVLYHLRQVRNCSFAIIGYTMDQCEESVLPLLEEACEDVGCIYDVKWGRRPIVFLHGRDEAGPYVNQVRFFGSNSRKSRKSLQGQSFQLAYVDEATNIEPDMLAELRRRMRQLGDERVIYTCNTEGEDHPFYEDYVLRAKEIDMRVELMTIQDHPAMSPTFRRQLLDEPDSAMRDRNLRGIWRSRRGRVYSSHKPLEERPHVDDIEQWAVTVDPGDSSSSHALLLALHRQEGAEAMWWVYDEWRRDWTREHEWVSHDDQARQIHDWIDTLGIVDRIAYGVCDSAAQSMRVALSESLNIDVYNSVKTRKHVPDVLMDSVDTLRMALHRGNIQLCHDTPRLLREINQCVWDETQKRDRPTESGLIHGLVALRYWAYMAPLEDWHVVPDAVW